MKCCICKLDINTQQSRVWLSEGVAHRTCRDDREKSLTQAENERLREFVGNLAYGDGRFDSDKHSSGEADHFDAGYNAAAHHARKTAKAALEKKP